LVKPVRAEDSNGAVPGINLISLRKAEWLAFFIPQKYAAPKIFFPQISQKYAESKIFIPQNAQKGAEAQIMNYGLLK